MGNLVGLEDSTGMKSGLQRDASGLPVATVDPLGAITYYQYDPLGNLVALTDPRGRVKRFTYSPGGMLARVEEPSGDAARYEYDPAGRLAAIHRPSGGVTRMVYDPMGNPTRLTGPAGDHIGYSYDVAGRLVSVTDAAGRVTRYRYDRSGRLTEKQLPDGRRVTYQHDVSGNLLLADEGAFPVRSGYDQAGRLIRREYPAIRKSVAYAYDSQGLRTKLTDSEGRTTRYEYNAIKQLAAIALPDGKRIAFTYDVKERLASIQYPNGITGRWDYDAAGRIIKIMYRNQHGKSIAGWTYRYDPAGNLSERQDIEGRTTRFQHDLAGQLTEEAAPGGTVRYRYLPGGNRASVEEGGTLHHYHHDTADRLNEAGGERLTYDPSGNLIRRERSRAATFYEYDSGSRLVKVMGADGKTTTFGYAPTGERVWKRDRTGMTYYLYDGFNLVQELEEAGRAKAAYVHGAGIDRPLAMLRNGRTYYYHADRLGSIMLLSDDRGAVAATYDYDAFGGLRAPPASVPNPFTFAGREWDASTDLYYYRARYYDPKLGRFLSPDPISGRLEEPLDSNPYLYVRNNPGRFIDPLGLWTAAQQQVLSDLASAINQGKSIAIGRLPDTLPLAKDPRYWVLNTPKGVWTPELNKRVIEIGMEKGARIVPVSPATIENVGATVYGTELQQLQAAGYSNIAPIPSPAAQGGLERVTKILKENKGLIAIKAVRSTYNILTSPNPGEQAKSEAGGWLGMGAGLIIGGPIGAVIGDIVGGGLTDQNMTNVLTGNDQDYQNRSAFERNAGEQFIKNLEKIRIIEIQTNIDRIKKSGLPFDTETMLTNIDRTKKSSLPFDTKTDTAGSTPQVGYNPLDDPNLKSGEKKSINIAEIDQLGDEFRQGPGSESKATKEQGTHQVVQQPPSYTDAEKPPEIAGGTQQVPYPPYPPGYPPDSGQSGARVPWDTLIGQSSGHGGKSQGGTGVSGTPVTSPHPGSGSGSSRTASPPPGGGTGGNVKEPCTEEITCQGWAKGIECARAKREGRGTCIVSQQQVGNCYYRAFEEGLRRGLGLTNSPKPKGC
jgi:RHS repeat-associated protein